ncbi:nucleolar protein 10-like [Coccinella septempunctata]|uniref:nucleolar protein 10-like n=1 Tax=Coccinella septempunctata TaxID=41139 RepID=UPI001D082099|nr:nucleolar protein 10-like [Coccinella septempunctata]
MEVFEYDNVKIYNLSCGKSLPEWLSERKRRALLKKDVDLRRRIELIQDFEMPDISTSVKVTPDGQYIIATGIYKPRVKCFDVNNLSQKFDRCFDSEAITFELLSDDYSKLVFLQCDRYVEFHVAHGRHYRLRIPKYGRDMKYFLPTGDLFIVGVTSDIYRLNLVRGQFLTPFVSEASVINKCAINKEYSLVMCGTKEGKVECWDPRCRNLIGTLDVALNCLSKMENVTSENFPSITALNMDGPLHMGVGTANGMVLLYDIRSSEPYMVKDHMERLPIKDIEFNKKENIVFSMNKSILKMWDKNSGKPYANIETSSELNNLCVVPDTGLLFIANEKPKILTYYLPSLGPAPKWASFLDSLTEELEESNVESIYDDYKFVTRSEVNALGLDLDDLVKNNLLRAYMHGYFMDARFYNKVKSAAQPFAFKEYRQNRIKKTIERSRRAKILPNLPNLPRVNKKLALELMKTKSNVLNDDRFRNLFLNQEFEIDENSEEYRLINNVAKGK